MPTSPLRLMFYGFLLLLLGFLLAFAMVIKIIEAGFLLSFISYGASLSGLIIGMYGAASFAKSRR